MAKNKGSLNVRDMLHTKIIATIGPASRSPESVFQLIDAGVRIFRLNFSHGVVADHLAALKDIRRISAKARVNTAVLQDLPGPKIRIGTLPEGQMNLLPGQALILTTSPNPDPPRVFVQYKNLHNDVARDRTIYIDDGNIELRVEKIRGRDIHCLVIAGGVLKDHKGINLPGTFLSVSAPTPEDLKYLRIGAANGMNMTALSFVRTAKDIQKARAFLKSKRVFLIAKIEKFEALENIDEIIDAADGIMVARGDLGVEIPIEKVPGVQKMIIEKCNLAGKPVITATQMLDSMIERPKPTRAEATDIANAVMNGTDAVMLSGETAVGKFPVKAVQILAEIAREAEQYIFWHGLQSSRDESCEITDAISRVAAEAARDLHASVILTPTRSGKTSLFISRFKPRCPIIAFTGDRNVLKELVLSWGVLPLMINQELGFSAIIRKMKSMVRQQKLASAGELAVITAGSPNSRAGQTNLVVVEKI